MASYEKSGHEKNIYDVEYQQPAVYERHHSVVVPDASGAVHGESFTIGNSTYAKLQRLAGRFHVEQRGIERVPEDERTDKSTFKVGTMWLAANMVVSSFAIGVLAVPVFALGFVDSVLTIFFINFLGILPVCFFSTFGPRFGMRQMILSRFFFGYYGVKIIAVFNILACLGWSSVNVIVGAQLIHAVNPDVPDWAAIIVIASGSFLVTLFGYKVVHYYEMIAWIPCFIVFLVVLGEFAHRGDFVNIPMGSGEGEAASILSFAASVFGFATGWASYASDYTCYQPVTTSRTKIFFYVFAGLMFPLCFTQMLGVAIATAIPTNQAYADAYATDAVGGLLHEVLVPPLGGFGKFCVVILALSIVGNNLPNGYSASFSLQVLTHYAQKVPRFLWTLVVTIIYCAIAIPGAHHFESVLENFMLIIGYWLAIYEGISLPEHFVFKRGMSGYAPEIYDQPKLLPPGIAAAAAFCFGILGATMGMAQVWFIGPIGTLIGVGYGGDIGFELAFAFTAITSNSAARSSHNSHAYNRIRLLHTIESRIGYRLVLGGTRHFGYYEEGTIWPFPVGAALRRMEDRLYVTLGLKDNSLVLDAGTGNGPVAIYMAKRGLRVQAIDLLDKHVQRARHNVKRNRLEDKLQVSNGNYEKLGFDDETFEGAYTMETLVHASDPDQAMREFYRVLKPGGVVTHVEYEHDMDNNHNPVGRKALRRINTYAHMPAFEQFSLGSIQQKLEKVGFEKVEVHDLSQNIAPMMRFFFLLAYLPYLLIQLLGLEAHFVNAMAAVELWRHSDDVRYLMVKARKPRVEVSRSDELRRR